MSKLRSLTSVSRTPLDSLYLRASCPPLFQGERPEPELATVVTAGELAAVRELLPLALAGPASWRGRIRLALHALTADRLDQLPALDHWLREAYPAVAPQPDEWSTLSPQILGRVECANAEDWQVLGLCASHRNGYVREQAVRLLASGPAEIALPFLLIRANDWAPPVRALARSAVENLLQPAAAVAFVRCLPLLDRLAGGTRVAHADLVARVESLLLDPRARPALEAGLESTDPRVRRRCFVLAARLPHALPEAVVLKGATDRDMVVRRLAIAVARALPPGATRAALLTRAAGDPASTVRWLAFDYWRHEAWPTARATLEGFLLDPAAGLRAEAQAAWQGGEQRDLAAWYRARLDDTRGRRLAGAVAGLGEVGEPGDAERVLPLVRHRSAKVRRMVIRTLGRLAPERSVGPLVDALLGDTGRVAREALRCLDHRLGDLDPEALWTGAPAAANQLARRRLLVLFRGLNKWVWLDYILRGVASSGADLRAQAQVELERWHAEFNRRVNPLSTRQQESLAMLLEAVRERLPSRLVREVRFVLGVR
jgi:HEAT repeat protein